MGFRKIGNVWVNEEMITRIEIGDGTVSVSVVGKENAVKYDHRNNPEENLRYESALRAVKELLDANTSDGNTL